MTKPGPSHREGLVKFVKPSFCYVDQLQAMGPWETEERLTSGYPQRRPAAHMAYAASPQHSGPNWVQIVTQPSGLPTLISSERHARPLIIHQMKRGQHP